jgi:hypothetical protein
MFGREQSGSTDAGFHYRADRTDAASPKVIRSYHSPRDRTTHTAQCSGNANQTDENMTAVTRPRPELCPRGGGNLPLFQKGKNFYRGGNSVLQREGESVFEKGQQGTHTKKLIATLTEPPIHKRLHRYWPNDLLTRF